MALCATDGTHLSSKRVHCISNAVRLDNTKHLIHRRMCRMMSIFRPIGPGEETVETAGGDVHSVWSAKHRKPEVRKGLGAA